MVGTEFFNPQYIVVIVVGRIKRRHIVFTGVCNNQHQVFTSELSEILPAPVIVKP